MPNVSSPAIKPMMTWRKTAVALVLIVAALSLAVWYSGKAWLETRMKQELLARGVTGLEFSLSSISPHSTTFSDIRFGTLSLKSLQLDYGPLELLQGNIGGTWALSDIVLRDAPLDMPPLHGEGTLQRRGGTYTVEGVIQSADATVKADFTLDYPQDGTQARLVVHSAVLPWNGGRLRARGVAVPLAGKSPVSFKLEVQEVPLNTLLQQATGNRASATGVVSGTIPVTIARDGTFTLHAGKLQAQEAGTVSLQPDVIPGDNQQVAVVRDVMQDFHYRSFVLTLDSGKDKKMSMLLSLSGNNPDKYNGREVNLNVRLTGDVLSLFQQSVTTITDPRKFLKDTHAK